MGARLLLNAAALRLHSDANRECDSPRQASAIDRLRLIRVAPGHRFWLGMNALSAWGVTRLAFDMRTCLGAPRSHNT